MPCTNQFNIRIKPSSSNRIVMDKGIRVAFGVGVQGPPGPVNLSNFMQLLGQVATQPNMKFDSNESAIAGGRTDYYIASTGHVSAPPGTLIFLI